MQLRVEAWGKTFAGLCWWACYPAAVQQTKNRAWTSAAVSFFVLLVAAVILYGNAVGNSFTFDDHAYIKNNPNIRSLDGVGYLFFHPLESGQTLRGHLYRPFAALVQLGIGTVAGFEARSYHVANIVLYALNGVLLLGLLRRFVEHRLAVVVVAVFFCHPVHTEVVASAVGITELLAFQLGVAALWFGLHHKVSPWRDAAAGVCFLLALLSKETAVVYIGVALLAAVFLRVDRSRLVRLALVLMVPLLVYFVMRHQVMGTFLRAPEVGFAFLDNPLVAATGLNRTMNAMVLLLRSQWLLLWPLKLSADYSYNALPVVASWSVPAVLALVVHAGLVVVAWLLRRRLPLCSLGIGVIFIGILPASNLLFCGGTIFGERFLYLPSVGCALLAGALWRLALSSGARWRRVATILVILLVVAGSVRTVVRNRDWADDYTLFSSVLRVCPDNAKAHYNVGLIDFERGDLDTSHRHAERAVAIYPRYIDARILLARLETHFGRPQVAEQLLREALGFGIEHEELYVELGNLYIDSNRLEQAVELLGQGVARIPESARIPYNLAMIHMAAGDHDQARPLLEAAVANGDLPLAHYALGHVALAEGDFVNARREMRALRWAEGLRLQAVKFEAFCLIQTADLAQAEQLLLQHLADSEMDPDHRLLLAAARAGMGDGRGAEEELRRLRRITGGDCSLLSFPDLCAMLMHGT